MILLDSLLFTSGVPPIMTDGTGTPGNGYLELNIAYNDEYQDVFSRYEAPSMDLNYGIGDTFN